MLASVGWSQDLGVRKAAAKVLLLDAYGELVVDPDSSVDDYLEEGVVVGDRGLISVKSREGEDWRVVQAPVKSLLTGVARNGEATWGVGHDKTILRGGGSSWKIVAYDTGEREDIPVRWTLLDLHWFDAKNGIIVGSYGLIMRTNDGGKTWSEKRIEWTGFDPELDINEMHLYKLRTSPNGTLFCAADEGAILRSKDKGKTWDKPDTGEYGAFYDVLPLDDNTILAIGILGTVVRSTDGGDTWTKVDTGTRSILHALHKKGDELWALGNGGTRLKSTDLGATFKADNYKERVAITGVAPDGRMLTEKGFRPW